MDYEKQLISRKEFFNPTSEDGREKRVVGAPKQDLGLAPTTAEVKAKKEAAAAKIKTKVDELLASGGLSSDQLNEIRMGAEKDKSPGTGRKQMTEPCDSVGCKGRVRFHAVTATGTKPGKNHEHSVVGHCKTCGTVTPVMTRQANTFDMASAELDARMAVEANYGKLKRSLGSVEAFGSLYGRLATLGTPYEIGF